METPELRIRQLRKNFRQPSLETLSNFLEVHKSNMFTFQEQIFHINNFFAKSSANLAKSKSAKCISKWSLRMNCTDDTHTYAPFAPLDK